jgi:DNA-binding transcriptional regulator GbsR (MarR family)
VEQQVAEDTTPAPAPVSAAERIRREFAQAWGAIGAAWGVAPSTAAVQGYFLVHGGPLTEPEIRRALGLSHRAAAMALSECTEWGLIERAEGARRTGRRGPQAAAYLAVGNNWEWFRRVARARKERETDPVVPVIERCAELADQEAASGGPEAAELAHLSGRLDGLLRFVHLFDRGVAILVDASPTATQRLFALLDELDDASLRRLVALLETVDPHDLARATDALASLPPAAARRLVGLAGTPGIGRILGH